MREGHHVERARRDSNTRPSAPEADALSTELRAQRAPQPRHLRQQSLPPHEAPLAGTLTLHGGEAPGVAGKPRAPPATVAHMDLSLFFAGTGGSVPSARRGLPAVLVRRGGERILFDCGEGTQRQLVRSVGLADVGSVFITHLPADHWLGLKELMGAMRIVYGRLPYELSFSELAPAQAVDRDGYAIAAIGVRHRGEAS